MVNKNPRRYTKVVLGPAATPFHHCEVWLLAWSYKPNFQFRFQVEPGDLELQARIFITAWVETSRGDIKPWDLTPQYAYPETIYDDLGSSLRMPPVEYAPVMPRRPLIAITGSFKYTEREIKEYGEDGFYNRLRTEIRSLEHHEMDEWSKVNGELRWDPHK